MIVLALRRRVVRVQFGKYRPHSLASGALPGARRAAQHLTKHHGAGCYRGGPQRSVGGDIPFAALICNGGQPIAAAGADAAVPTESVAVAFDVTHTLDLNGLAGAYDRIAAAKAMRKTAPAPGSQTIELTLGVIFATDSTVPLEELADELERLNARTLSDQWADMVVVATKGQISYSAQMVGSSKIDGMLLAASPGAKDGAIFDWLGNPKMRRPAETSSNGTLGHG